MTAECRHGAEWEVAQSATGARASARFNVIYNRCIRNSATEILSRSQSLVATPQQKAAIFFLVLVVVLVLET